MLEETKLQEPASAPWTCERRLLVRGQDYLVVPPVAKEDSPAEFAKICAARVNPAFQSRANW